MSEELAKKLIDAFSEFTPKEAMLKTKNSKSVQDILIQKYGENGLCWINKNQIRRLGQSLEIIWTALWSIYSWRLWPISEVIIDLTKGKQFKGEDYNETYFYGNC